MTVQWADVSEYQCPVDDRYPFPVLAIRSNDGTYKDHKFSQNYTWACRKLAAGRLSILIVYCVYRTNWLDVANTMRSMIGTPHPRMVAMIDVESWQGQITGDQSEGINRLYWALADWLGNPRRVIGYGNKGDLDMLWPTRPPGVRLVVASYGRLPTYPGMIAHQYSDCAPVAPFGACDINSANDIDLAGLAAAFGLDERTTHFRERNVLRLDATAPQLDGQPNGDWPNIEECVSLVGPAGGWSGRQVVHVHSGYGGMFIQEAWWQGGPANGTHVVNRYDAHAKQGGAFLPQLSSAFWEAPLESRGFIFRYTSRARGSLTIETEH